MVHSMLRCLMQSLPVSRSFVITFAATYVLVSARHFEVFQTNEKRVLHQHCTTSRGAIKSENNINEMRTSDRTDVSLPTASKLNTHGQHTRPIQTQPPTEILRLRHIHFRRIIFRCKNIFVVHINTLITERSDLRRSSGVVDMFDPTEQLE